MQQNTSQSSSVSILEMIITIIVIKTKSLERQTKQFAEFLSTFRVQSSDPEAVNL